MSFAFLGLGNEFRGDDKIGLEVVESLKREKKYKGSLFLKTQVPENHIFEIVKFNPDVLVIIDSADFKGKPGEFKLIEEEEVLGSFVSTHTTPITLFLKALKGEISPRVLFIGIQYKNINFGSGMSREVRDSVKRITDYIKRLV